MPLKLIRFFMSRNTFTKLEFSDSLIWTENALKFTYAHLHFQKFSGVLPPDPSLQQVEGMREGDSWERRLREGRESEGNVQSKQNLRITPR
jgi:hypothetical protein